MKDSYCEEDEDYSDELTAASSQSLSFKPESQINGSLEQLIDSQSSVGKWTDKSLFAHFVTDSNQVDINS